MTHYETLGILPGATSAQIRNAYRMLAKQHHPDLLRQADVQRREQAEARMKAINEAYSILGDEKKRSHYDSTLPVNDWQRKNASHDPASTRMAHTIEDDLYDEWAHQQAVRYARTREAEWARRKQKR